MADDDFESISRIRSGDREAYTELIRRNHAAVMGLCLSMLNNRPQAEDAAQDIFIKAYRSLDKFREDSSFSTWLYRIASNHCLDLLRQRSRERADSLENLLDKEGDRAQRLFFAEPPAVLAPEDADLIERALSRLPPDYRLILTLREVQGLNYKELAEALECSLDAVKARLKRARRSLEEMGRHILESDSV